MALNGNNANVNDDRLAAALIDILSQDGGHRASTAKRFPAVGKLRSNRGGGADISSLMYAAQQIGENEVECRSCGAANPRSNRYCGQCAAYLGDYAEKHVFEQIEIQSINIDVALIAINEDSSDGVRIPLKYNETILGRNGDSRFPSDAFLSPRHARLIVEDRSLFIEDLDSLNGTFLRTRGEVKLTPGDCFLAGRELLRFERFEQVVSTKAKSVDGTRYMGSPPSGGDFKLVQIGIGNITQNIYCLSEAGANFGREQGDIIFNRDRFMSGRHAQIFPRDDGNYYLLDMGSSNGTWFRLSKRCRLYHGDLIFLGQQLFRVDSPDIM